MIGLTLRRNCPACCRMPGAKTKDDDKRPTVARHTIASVTDGIARCVCVCGSVMWVAVADIAPAEAA